MHRPFELFAERVVGELAASFVVEGTQEGRCHELAADSRGKRVLARAGRIIAVEASREEVAVHLSSCVTGPRASGWALHHTVSSIPREQNTSFGA